MYLKEWKDLGRSDKIVIFVMTAIFMAMSYGLIKGGDVQQIKQKAIKSEMVRGR